MFSSLRSEETNNLPSQLTREEWPSKRPWQVRGCRPAPGIQGQQSSKDLAVADFSPKGKARPHVSCLNKGRQNACRAASTYLAGNHKTFGLRAGMTEASVMEAAGRFISLEGLFL